MAQYTVSSCILGFFQGFEYFVDEADGELAANIVNEQLCHKQSAMGPVEPPIIEVFCDNGPLIGNQIRFVLSTGGAQLVLCDVHAYGGNDY